MYNSYLGNTQYGQYYPNYSQAYGNYSTPQMQQRATQMQMPQSMPTQDIPFNDVKFVTADEAKAYIVAPNTKVMLMDRDKSVFYIKSADSLGKSTLEGFKYSKLDNNSTESVSHDLDLKEYVKMSDLQEILSKNDTSEFLTIKDAEKFLTKNDLKAIDTKLEQLSKQIKINDILKGDDLIGK